MYCLGYPERPHPCNQLFFMLHELVFLGYLSRFASYSYSCQILQPYIAGMVQMHSDGLFFSVGASQIKTFIKNQCLSTTASSDTPDGYM